MIDEEFACRFTQEWIEAWNGHKIEHILEHYAPSIEFTSPFVVRLTSNSYGKIKNETDLEQYLRQALQLYLLQPNTFNLMHMEKSFGVQIIILFRKIIFIVAKNDQQND